MFYFQMVGNKTKIGLGGVKMSLPLSIFTLVGFFILAAISPNSPGNQVIDLGLWIVVLLTGYIRFTTLQRTFQGKLDYLQVATSVISHIVLFSSLFIILRSDYTISDPTNVFVDSIYYSTDTTTTNGASGITPKTGSTKVVHTFNILDSYLMILTLGSFIYARIMTTGVKK